VTELSARELDRLREIAALRLGDGVDDPIIQALVDRAADELELPLAAISIVMDAAQYFIASHGLSGWIGVVQGTPVEWAFCRHTIAAREPFMVEDAGTHPVVRDNPLVQIDGIRSYLGVPLITSKDEAIGTLCVLGVETRKFSQADVETLRQLAAGVLTELEARRG
jgi:GAF domain-containing protein